MTRQTLTSSISLAYVSNSIVGCYAPVSILCARVCMCVYVCMCVRSRFQHVIH
jgi:hypothetical protein